MTKIVYSQSRHPAMEEEGAAYENPRHFTGPRAGVTEAVVIGDFPRIVAAYEGLDVKVTRPDLEAKRAETAAVVAARSSLSPDERANLYIPDDWRDLPWTQKTGEDGLTLRALASSLSDEPVLNKTSAAEVVEAELRRRAGGEQA